VAVAVLEGVVAPPPRVVVLVVRILFALHVVAVGTNAPLGSAAAKENVTKILYPLILS